MSLQQSLDSRYYTDPLVFARERERIFKPAWWLLGPAHLCSEKGQYLADTVCGWPVFAIRGTDGVLRGFHNVCRHRGAALLEDGSGQCRVVTCPYHAWGYATDGRLKATPGFSARDVPTELDMESLSLLPVMVREWRGMVFVSLSDDESSFDNWIATLAGLMEGFPGLDLMSYHGSFEVEGNANWKTYCDNTVEGYHLPSVHPRLATAVKQGSVDIRSYDDGALVAFHVDYGGASSSLRGNEGLWAYLYPGFQIAISANAFKIERVEAAAIDRVRSINWAWYTNLSRDAIDDSFDWSRTVVQEDLGICEKVQLNMGNGIYQHGPLSPVQEQHVAGFQALIRKAIDD
ncbi:MAG: aromatic ring-hydroxylating dioxygenase subunit alpha [Gammaproteobacteria bacterium]|nr:aromatic ring-hydroxylating dioxygenase subunit alpha [Gammaproteobacteria bacterium]